MGLEDDHTTLAIFDHLKGQLMDDIRKHLVLVGFKQMNKLSNAF